MGPVSEPDGMSSPIPKITRRRATVTRAPPFPPPNQPRGGQKNRYRRLAAAKRPAKSFSPVFELRTQISFYLPNPFGCCFLALNPLLQLGLWQINPDNLQRPKGHGGEPTMHLSAAAYQFQLSGSVQTLFYLSAFYLIRKL